MKTESYKAIGKAALFLLAAFVLKIVLQQLTAVVLGTLLTRIAGGGFGDGDMRVWQFIMVKELIWALLYIVAMLWLLKRLNRGSSMSLREKYGFSFSKGSLKQAATGIGFALAIALILAAIMWVVGLLAGLPTAKLPANNRLPGDGWIIDMVYVIVRRLSMILGFVITLVAACTYVPDILRRHFSPGKAALAFGVLAAFQVVTGNVWVLLWSGNCYPLWYLELARSFLSAVLLMYLLNDAKTVWLAAGYLLAHRFVDDFVLGQFAPLYYFTGNGTGAFQWLNAFSSAIEMAVALVIWLAIRKKVIPALTAGSNK